MDTATPADAFCCELFSHKKSRQQIGWRPLAAEGLHSKSSCFNLQKASVCELPCILDINIPYFDDISFYQY